MILVTVLYLVLVVVIGFTIYTLLKNREGAGVGDTSKKGTIVRDSVTIEREHFIPITPKAIREAIPLLFDPADYDKWEQLILAVECIIDLDSKKISHNLIDNFHVLDPTLRAPLPASLTSGSGSRQKFEQIETDFLVQLHDVLAKANYTPLSANQLDFALKEDYLLNVPLTVDWKLMDERLFTRAKTALAERKNAEDVSDWAHISNKLWIYHRGVGVDQTVDYFVLSKIDFIIVAFFAFIWDRTAGFILRLLTAKGIIKKDSPFALGPLSDTSTETFDESLEKPDLRSRVVERRTLSQILTNRWRKGIKEIFGKLMLQEPTFHHVVLIYRFAFTEEQILADQEKRSASSEGLRSRIGPDPVKSPTSTAGNTNSASPAAVGSVPNRRGIFIKTFRDIPFADLEAVFPAKKANMRPLDVVMFGVTACVGIISLIINLESDSSVLGGVSLISFLGLAAKAFTDYRNAMIYYESALLSALYGKSDDTHTGVILQLMNQLTQQEWKEVVIAYALLVQLSRKNAAGVSKQLLDEACESFLQEKCGLDRAEAKNIDFEVEDAVAKLEKLKLAVRTAKPGVTEPLYSPIPLDKALSTLQERWGKYLMNPSETLLK